MKGFFGGNCSAFCGAEMASSRGRCFLSEDQFLCTICLDVFRQPVSTPCGHNFCLSCITSYWDVASVCRCPLCKHTFDRKPELNVNTLISVLAEKFTLLDVKDNQKQKNHSGNQVKCDICMEKQHDAVKSCLECLASYCQIHLEPHERVSGLRRHTLVQPLSRLEDRICNEHNKPLKFFCRNEKVLVCNVCAHSQHLNHDIVHLEEAFKDMKAWLGDMEAQVQKIIWEKLQKVRDVKESVKQHETETIDMTGQCVQDFTELVCDIQRTQTELIRVMEKKQKAAEEEAGAYIKSIGQDIIELQETVVKLKELRQTEDQLFLLQNVSVTSVPSHTMDLPALSFNCPTETQQIRMSLSRCVAQMQKCLEKMTTDIFMYGFTRRMSNTDMLRYMQQYEVNFALDPDTAHPFLTLSDDRKQVRYERGSGVCENTTLTLNPKMFTNHLAVLSCRGFFSRMFYFEVFVGVKTEWCVGVATASFQRTGPIARIPQCGLWALWFLEDRFETYSGPNQPVHYGTVERVGVFVDYDAGQVQFCDVNTAAVLHTFRECRFTEELYAYVNPCDDDCGTNLDPITLVPVCADH